MIRVNKFLKYKHNCLLQLLNSLNTFLKKEISHPNGYEILFYASALRNECRDVYYYFKYYEDALYIVTERYKEEKSLASEEEYVELLDWFTWSIEDVHAEISKESPNLETLLTYFMQRPNIVDFLMSKVPKTEQFIDNFSNFIGFVYQDAGFNIKGYYCRLYKYTMDANKIISMNTEYHHHYYQLCKKYSDLQLLKKLSKSTNFERIQGLLITGEMEYFDDHLDAWVAADQIDESFELKKWKYTEKEGKTKYWPNMLDSYIAFVAKSKHLQLFYTKLAADSVETPFCFKVKKIIRKNNKSFIEQNSEDEDISDTEEDITKKLKPIELKRTLSKYYDSQYLICFAEKIEIYKKLHDYFPSIFPKPED